MSWPPDPQNINKYLFTIKIDRAYCLCVSAPWNLIGIHSRRTMWDLFHARRKKKKSIFAEILTERYSPSKGRAFLRKCTWLRLKVSLVFVSHSSKFGGGFVLLLCLLGAFSRFSAPFFWGFFIRDALCKSSRWPLLLFPKTQIIGLGFERSRICWYLFIF